MNEEYINLCRAEKPMIYKYYRDLLTGALYRYSTYKGSPKWAVHRRSKGCNGIPKIWVMSHIVTKKNHRVSSSLWAIDENEMERQLLIEEMA